MVPALRDGQLLGFRGGELNTSADEEFLDAKNGVRSAGFAPVPSGVRFDSRGLITALDADASVVLGKVRILRFRNANRCDGIHCLISWPTNRPLRWQLVDVRPVGGPAQGSTAGQGGAFATGEAADATGVGP